MNTKKDLSKKKEKQQLSKWIQDFNSSLSDKLKLTSSHLIGNIVLYIEIYFACDVASGGNLIGTTVAVPFYKPILCSPWN